MDFSIFVSEDDAPFFAWLIDTADTAAIYPGEGGKSYAFYSVVRDFAGNVEPVPSIADAVTTVFGPPELQGDFNGDRCVDRSDYDILMDDVRNGLPDNLAHDLNDDGVVNRADARTLVRLFTNPRGMPCN